MRVFNLEEQSEQSQDYLQQYTIELDRHIEATIFALGLRPGTDYPYLGVTGQAISQMEGRPITSSVKGPTGSNGRLDTSTLVPVQGAGLLLRSDAAYAWLSLVAAARKDGLNITLTDAYRSYEAQVDVKRRKPRLAATPGHSNHGWGLAVDVNLQRGGFSSPVYRWLFYNGGRFGWINPKWARPGGSKPEPWHWEYEKP